MGWPTTLYLYKTQNELSTHPQVLIGWEEDLEFRSDERDDVSKDCAEVQHPTRFEITHQLMQGGDRYDDMFVNVRGTKISPPSKARTSPAPLLVHTLYLRLLSAASRSFVNWDHQP